MKKLLILLLFTSGIADAGSLTIYQDLGGNIGSVILTPAQQIFFDTTTSSGFVSSVGPLTWNITIGSGLNRLLVVGCGLLNADQITSITISGSSMTFSTSTFDGSITGTAIYTLVNPTSGPQGISVATASGISDRVVCGATAFSGVNQSNPVDIATGTINYPGGGTSGTTLVTTAAHEAIFDVLNDENNEVVVAGAGQVQQFQFTSSYTVATSSKSTQNAGSYSMAWSNVSNPHVESAISIRPSP